MKQGLVRLLYNLGKVHGVDITHDNVCSSMLSCFYSHLLSTGRPISSLYLPFLTPRPSKVVGVLILHMVSSWVEWLEKSCVGCISETIRYRFI